MAEDQLSSIVEPVTAPQHYVPATARELRAQSVHRLQIGLFGLIAMLLIVGLANIIMDQAKHTDATDPIEQVIAADEPPKKPAVDPLADIGVAPPADPAPEVVEPAAPPPQEPLLEE